VLIPSHHARTLVAALAGALVLFAGCTQTAVPTDPSSRERLSATEARFTTTEYPIGVVVHFVRSTANVPACA
jgi:hypothetical protein